MAASLVLSAQNADMPMSARVDPGIFFTALQEQLGLKLRPAKAIAEVLVIDRMEKPPGELTAKQLH